MYASRHWTRTATTRQIVTVIYVCACCSTYAVHTVRTHTTAPQKKQWTKARAAHVHAQSSRCCYYIYQANNILSPSLVVINAALHFNFETRAQRRPLNRRWHSNVLCTSANLLEIRKKSAKFCLFLLAGKSLSFLFGRFPCRRCFFIDDPTTQMSAVDILREDKRSQCGDDVGSIRLKHRCNRHETRLWRAAKQRPNARKSLSLQSIVCAPHYVRLLRESTHWFFGFSGWRNQRLGDKWMRPKWYIFWHATKQQRNNNYLSRMFRCRLRRLATRVRYENWLCACYVTSDIACVDSCSPDKVNGFIRV